MMRVFTRIPADFYTRTRSAYAVSFNVGELHMIYARCLFYEMIMVVTGPLMDLLDRHRLGRTRPYVILDGIYGRAWDALREARTELEDKAFAPVPSRV